MTTDPFPNSSTSYLPSLLARMIDYRVRIGDWQRPSVTQLDLFDPREPAQEGGDDDLPF